jgi:hypothetical protein
MKAIALSLHAMSVTNRIKVQYVSDSCSCKDATPTLSRLHPAQSYPAGSHTAAFRSVVRIR